MMIPPGLVISGCLLLLAFMLWKEVVRTNRHLLAWRLLASAIAVAALACMILPVVFKVHQSKSTGSEVVLLTDGFSADSLHAFLKGDTKDIPVYTTENRLLAPGLAFKTALSPGIFSEDKQLHVFGFGLDEIDLKNLNGKPFNFHPSPIPSGTSIVNWTKKVGLGQRLVVQGNYNNTSAQPARIFLRGLNTTLDSIWIPPFKQLKFEISATPKHIDRAVYSLLVLTVRDTLENEPLPVEVIEIKPLKILILSASPDFENKFLKNWLASNAYSVVVRTMTSKNKYEKEFLNIPEMPIDALTRLMLEKFDVLISDATVLTDMSNRELTAIRLHVEKGRLGLIIKADSPFAGDLLFFRQFPLYRATKSTRQSTILQWSDMTGQKAELLAEDMVYIKNTKGTQPLITDQQTRVLVTSGILGAGKIVLTTLGNTYTWVLAGNKAWYHSLWSSIIDKAQKNLPTENKWSVHPDLPVIDGPTTINLQTASKDDPVSHVQESKVYLKQNKLLPYLWTGTFWPLELGWHKIEQKDGPAYWWYVFGNNNWQHVKAANRLKLTREYTTRHPFKAGKLQNRPSLSWWQVPKFYFYVLFIGCCTFLWIEKKYMAIHE